MKQGLILRATGFKLKINQKYNLKASICIKSAIMSNLASGFISVGYWSIRGLAAPLRMLVLYAGLPLDVINYDVKLKEEGGYDASEWFSVKPALKERNPLINLPFVIDGDIIISQSNACLSYLGKKCGAWGQTEASSFECDQLLCELMDLRNKMTSFAYSTAQRDRAVVLLDDVCGKNGILQKLELWLDRAVAQRGESGIFLVEDKATAPDFHMWELLDQYNGLSIFFDVPSPLTQFPRLQVFHSSFGSLPRNQKYMISKLVAMPYNNKMAGFGATLTNGPWVTGQEYDWGNLTGTY
eukprot:gene13015-27463_t